MTIQSLIDKQDSFEIVRDKIGLILATESTSQQALAVAASRDPNSWKFRTFLERSNPWEQVLNDQSDLAPIVNVWFDNSGFDQRSGNVVERQQSDSIFNIDCYGFGVSEEAISGHTPGDFKATTESQRAAKLVRNILMSSGYTYLGLTRGTVGKRWIQSITTFQPQIDQSSIVHIIGTRIALSVSFNEFSPQYEGETLESVFVEMFNKSDAGEILIEAEYDYTT